MPLECSENEKVCARHYNFLSSGRRQKCLDGAIQTNAITISTTRIMYPTTMISASLILLQNIFHSNKEKVLSSIFLVTTDYLMVKSIEKVRPFFVGNPSSAHGCRTTKQFKKGVQRPHLWQIDHKASHIKILCVHKSIM